ncbi:hypothetical protein [Vulgatibacter sp.]|uniref:hypothetical protein n=1 Tax=Vulgatibacter sp. TaxID=1971226 RepID=UPI003569D57E
MSARPTQLYDVAVLGGALPGVVAAALLAQRGLRVLHVAPTAPGSYESGGFRLPLAPELLPATKILPALRESLDELSLAAVVNRSLQPISAQVVLPRARLELREERELQRAFGGEAAGVAGALARLAASVEEFAPAVGGPLLPQGLGERFASWRHRRSNRTLLEAPLVLDGAGPMEAALLALHHFTAADASPPNAVAFARATAPLLHGFHRLPEGGLAAHLVGHVRARRGDALVAKVDEIALEGSRFAGLQIKGELWRARTLIAALPASELVALLPESRRRDKLAAQAEAATATPLHLRSIVLAAQGLPPGLGPLAVVAGFGGGEVLLEQRPALRSDGKEDPSLQILTALSTAGGDALEAILEEVLPFHRRHVRHEATPPSHPARYELAGERPFGFEGVSPRTALPGVLLGGPELLPGLGLEGAFLAGRRLAQAIQAITGREKKSV